MLSPNERRTVVGDQKDATAGRDLKKPSPSKYSTLLCLLSNNILIRCVDQCSEGEAYRAACLQQDHVKTYQAIWGCEGTKMHAVDAFVS